MLPGAAVILRAGDKIGLARVIDVARVLVAEQLYRAWTILNNHPYHRA